MLARELCGRWPKGAIAPLGKSICDAGAADTSLHPSRGIGPWLENQILVRVTTANADFAHPEGALAVGPACVLNSRRTLLTQPQVDNRRFDVVNEFSTRWSLTNSTMLSSS